MANPNKLPIVEVFGPTIQGEGAMIGKQTMFIRAAHCDYLCGKCDSLFAVIPELYKPIVKTLTAQELWEEVNKIRGHCKWITLSGGNPALWDFSEFIKIAHEHSVRIAVETQGSVYKDWLSKVDVLTISPKGPGMEVDSQGSLADLANFLPHILSDLMRMKSPKTCLKIPVFGEEDLDFAEKVLKITYKIYPLYLSVGNPNPPEKELRIQTFGIDEHRENLLGSLEMITEAVMRRPLLADAIILPQLHVLIYGNKQGV